MKIWKSKVKCVGCGKIANCFPVDEWSYTELWLCLPCARISGLAKNINFDSVKNCLGCGESFREQRAWVTSCMVCWINARPKEETSSKKKVMGVIMHG